MRTRSHHRGFTLIEMMVVVAIVAILSGLVISASSKPVGASARSVSEQIVGTLNAAHLRAQATRRVHKVVFDDSHAWVMVASETGLVPSGAATYSTLQTLTFPAGVKIYDVSTSAIASPSGTAYTPTAVNYDLFIRPDGQSTQTTLFVGDGLHQWRVVVYHITGGIYAREFW
jgi:prepilin-type N-terminal cleavage/methylation domain-containing protein